MNEDSERTKDPRIVKRYSNRKLYDTRDSRYVTLQQIADLVRSGEDVQIIDNTTKENLTNVVLAQILYEEQKKGEEREHRPSLGMLRNLVQKGGEKLMTSLREGPIAKLVPRRESDDDERTARREGELHEDGAFAGEDAGSPGAIASLARQVHRLRAELADLRTRVGALEASGGPGRPKTRSGKRQKHL